MFKFQELHPYELFTGFERVHIAILQKSNKPLRGHILKYGVTKHTRTYY